MDDGDWPVIQRAFEEFDHDFTKRTFFAEHKWLVNAVKELESQNHRMKVEIARRDRLLLYKIWDNYLDMPSVAIVAVSTVTPLYILYKGYSYFLYLICAIVAPFVAAQIIARYREGKLRAQREKMFELLEGDWADIS